MTLMMKYLWHVSVLSVIKTDHLRYSRNSWIVNGCASPHFHLIYVLTILSKKYSSTS